MKKKKIGILTFHDADNLGAVLQAYALKTVIEKDCGAVAEIIDYKCNKITETKYVQKGSGLKNLIKYIPVSVYYYIKRRSFMKFRNGKLGCSEASYTKENIKKTESDYDIFITGSDQIWNPECSGDDYTYLLDFVSDNSKKYSYAASIGNYDISKAGSKWLELIKDYSGISVRENSAYEQLEACGISNVKVHADPVMLLSQEDWKSVMSEPIIKEKYVLVYMVLPDVNVMKKATEYAKKHNCKVISNKTSLEFILHNSPSEFLSWIYNADYVFTNSFHGTAFSLILNKKFFSDTEMVGGGINKRVVDLLEAAKTDNSIELMKNSALEYLKEICKSS